MSAAAAAATATPVADADLLARLVAVDTTSHRSNLPLVELLADYLERPGVDVVTAPSADGAKANLLVRVGAAPDGGGDDARRPGLVLSGHTDVVPALEEGWSSDPFELTDREDRYVARGSADMKGFLALAANLARETDPASLTAPLVLLFTFDEEVGTLGAKHLVDGWGEVEGRFGPLPTAAVVGEPTELAAVRLHKGHLKLRYRLTGRSAHSGYPHLGVNAIEAGGWAITALAELRAALAEERLPASAHFPEVPYAALNVGTVHGGSAVNVVPDRCELEVGVRVLPGTDADDLARRVTAAVREAVPPAVPVEATTLSASPPLECPADAPVHRHLCAALGQDGERSAAFATDAGWLQTLGLECVIWGPGSITVAHKPDEFVPKAHLAAARQRLAGMVHHFCRGEEAA